jgi:hypothetical protein
MDTDRKHLQSVLRSAASHEGSAFIEIYQNCNIFNDGAFDTLKEPATRDDYMIRLEHGRPITFGADNQFAVIHPSGGFGLRVVPTAEADPGEIVVHDETVAEPAYAFALSRLPGEDLRNTPIGVFRKVARNSYDTLGSRAGGDGEVQAVRRPRGRTRRSAGRRRHLDDPLAPRLPRSRTSATRPAVADVQDPALHADLGPRTPDRERHAATGLDVDEQRVPVGRERDPANSSFDRIVPVELFSRFSAMSNSSPSGVSPRR